ncbi:MAG: hypothetical protein QOJ01_595 [Solirubrobacterales bacterium]|nr:hypothetical protein [Solirubrobacterales bacterium]
MGENRGVLIAWLAFPAVLALLAVGLGLLVARIAGVRVAPALLMPLGFAALVVVGELTTSASATARLTVPIAVALALAGLALGRRSWRPPVERWALVAALAVFAVFAAPVVLSGQPTFGGFVKLDDTATWFAITDRLMEHGHSLAGLPPSSYEATLAFNLGAGYPVGAFVPFGVGAKLVGQDLSTVFQPYLAFLAAMLALSLYALTERLVRAPALRAAVAFLASQAALLYGYSLWGGVKELAVAALLPLAAAGFGILAAARGNARAAVPLAVAVAATIGVASPEGGIVWAGPLLAAAALILIREGGFARAARTALALVALIVVIALPWVLGTAFTPPTSASLTSGDALGNLLGPLNPLQVAGIWPAGDFRVDPSHVTITAALVVAVFAAALAGAVAMVRARAFEPLLYALGTLAAAFAILLAGSAWVGGKALAIASPAALFAALCAAGLLAERGRRLGAAALFAAIAAGVLWSNALAFHDVWLAPRGQLAELQRIGGMIGGEGPTLMTEYEPYGVRHFLRDAQPEGVSELRRSRIPLRGGGLVPKGGYADIDRLELNGVLAYRTLVLRRSPVASRPPSPYRRVWRGHYYEVWQRSPQAPLPLAHLSLGNSLDPVARPGCAALHSLASQAGVTRIAWAAGPPAIAAPLAGRGVPAGWSATVAGAVIPGSPGTVGLRVRVPSGGRYGVWVQGSARGSVGAAIDGGPIGQVGGEIQNSGQYLELGSAHLNAGLHRVTISYEDGGSLVPGTGGTPFALGPLVLRRAGDPERVRTAPASRAGAVCHAGQRLDWVEALAG